MTGAIPKNTKSTRRPYKQGVFEMYPLWRSVKGFMGQSKAQEVIKRAGNNGSSVSDVFTLRNQTEFAKTYKVENSTLTNWNKLIDREDLLKDVQEPARRQTKNVIASLYRTIIEKGEADEVRLWYNMLWDGNIRVHLTLSQEN